MNIIRPAVAFPALSLILLGAASSASDTESSVSNAVIDEQRAALARSTDGLGFGPQSPRDIDASDGANARTFEEAPMPDEMSLCNIHFHESAEHRGGEFTTYRGNGDGRGTATGFVYSGELDDAELAPLDEPIGSGAYGDLLPGDTIEVHYVYSTAQVAPGPTLGACLSESIVNPQLRVEAQVYVLVNDADALDFEALTAIDEVDGRPQAINVPDDTGAPVRYAGSTTGPAYNEAGSPLQVSWSVRPQVAKVDIRSVGAWLEDNPFDERYAHGVRNLVMNPALLSPIVN